LILRKTSGGDEDHARSVGRALDSAGFTQLVKQETRDMIFVLGGADGLPPTWRGRADVLISLSALTMPA